MLEGEPGIGKTTLWQAALAAVPPGARVLSCRPVEAETKLSYASVADLLEPVVDDALPSLPEPQRIAVEVALLRATSHGPAPDRRAVATGVQSLLRVAAAGAPLVLAIDDVQWVDVASAAVLAFALRRLADVAVRVVLTVRLAGGVAVDPLDLERTLPGRVRRLRLAPLSLSGIHHVIQAQLGLTFPRPTLTRITQASGGNPLFAVELARALADVDVRPVPGEPLPVPESLAALMATRVSRLPAVSREALLAAASLSAPTVDLVTAALGADATTAVDRAEAADVISVHDGRIRFTHPLLASTVYASSPPARRRAMHAALAGVVPELEERARHLALAVEEPDDAVAAQLSDAARGAITSGAPQTAVELAELALRRTPTDAAEARAQRSFELAEYVFRAGDAAEARRLLEVFVDEEPCGPLRARALELLARTLYVAGTLREPLRRCEEALADAAGDDELLARIHATAARVCYEDIDLARRHARAALDLLDAMPHPDPEVLGQALCAEVGVRFMDGGELPMDLVERGLELERVAPGPDVADRMSAALGVWLKLNGDFEGARAWLERTYRAAVEEGDDSSLPYALSHLPQLELWTGRWAEAERRALEHLQLSEETGQLEQRRQALFNLASVYAHLGRVDDARGTANELLAEAEPDDPWSASNALSVLGFLELSVGNSAEAAALLRRNLELRDTMGPGEPTRAHGDLVQAYVELGDVEEAGRVAAVFDARAAPSGREPMLALAAAARGVVAAARMDYDDASAAFDEALAHHDRAPVPFDRARTLLLLGQLQRRRGERKAARETFERARAAFDELGAPLWTDRATAELGRIPIRRGAGDELTPTEEKVVELVLQGHTNREVAQALFMSPKTVEAHLGRIYRKLDVTSRAQLGARMAERASAKP